MAQYASATVTIVTKICGDTWSGDGRAGGGGAGRCDAKNVAENRIILMVGNKKKLRRVSVMCAVVSDGASSPVQQLRSGVKTLFQELRAMVRISSLHPVHDDPKAGGSPSAAKRQALSTTVENARAINTPKRNNESFSNTHHPTSTAKDPQKGQT